LLSEYSQRIWLLRLVAENSSQKGREKFGNFCGSIAADAVIRIIPHEIVQGAGLKNP
jgi:hypothetical protein